MFRKSWNNHADKLVQLRNKAENNPMYDKEHFKTTTAWNKEIKKAKDDVKIEESKGKIDDKQIAARKNFLAEETAKYNAEMSRKEQAVRDHESARFLGHIINNLR